MLNWGLSVGYFPRKKAKARTSPKLGDRYPNHALDDSFGNGIASKPRDVMDIQLAHQMLPMFIHRLETHAQFRGDLLIGFSLRDQLQYFHLARAQGVVFLLGSSIPAGRFLATSLDLLDNGGAKKGFSLVNLANGGGQFVRGSLLH